MFRSFVAFAVAALVSGATAQSSEQHSPEAQAKLDKMLEGRVAGTPVNCLPVVHVLHPVAIDDQTLVFRDGPRIYLNNLRGSFECGKLDKMSDVAFASNANQVCSGDTLHFTSGMLEGACALGQFTPYRKP